jgi:glycosyltransferase involved in cell wall biosynthesis
VRALELAGFKVEHASRFRSYSSAPAGPKFVEAAGRERERVLAAWNAVDEAERPRLWFTYHVYYKAPDFIGPHIASHFAIPYVTAEASYAGKRDSDEWAGMQSAVKTAVRAAALNICFTPEDRQGLAQLVGPAQLRDLAPFIDPAPFVGSPLPKEAKGPARLVSVAMMRGGVKLASYEMLARALEHIVDEPWTLIVIGDGPHRSSVEAAFARLPGHRVHWAGELAPAAVAEHLAAADMFVWPGTGEAYGMAFLEAQAAGLPVVAQATAGVPSVVRHGVTGLLTPPAEASAFGAAVARLIRDAPLRQRLGEAARSFVVEERSLAAAALHLRRLLKPLIAAAPV